MAARFAVYTFLAIILLGGTTATAQPSFDAIVIEPWDDSYALASSRMGDISDLDVGVGVAHINQGMGAQFFWSRANGKVEADIAGDEINNNGVTAGGSAVFWSPGDYVLVPHPNGGGGGVNIRDLNNLDMVVGWAGVGERTIAFVWDAVSGSRWLDDLGVPTLTWRAYAINDAGLIAASHSSTGEPGDEKAFLFDLATETYIDLHGLLNPSGWGITSVEAVAENGVVAGDGSFEHDGGGIAAFVWSAGRGFTFLPGLNGGETMRVHPAGINSEGTVVGGALDGSDEWCGFIWHESYGIRDLAELAELPPGFNLQEATAINENGWILGRGFWSSVWGPDRAVVFVPRLASTSVEPQVAAGLHLRALSGARLDFSLPVATGLRLSVFDIRGRRVALLIDGQRAAGAHQVAWDGRREDGSRAASGIYLAQLETAQGAQATAKVVLTR